MIFSRTGAGILAAVLICGTLAASAASAQYPDPRYDELSRQVQQMQHELEMLRQRDLERQRWEQSVIRRLPDPYDPASYQPVPAAAASSTVSQPVDLDTDEEDDHEYEKFLTPVVTDCGNITFKPGVRIQARYTYDDESDNNDFFIRRFRLKAGGNAFDIADYYMELKIDSTARFETDPSPDAVVENAWLDFNLLDETHYLRVGLYDAPMSRDALTSDSKLLFMDRTLIYGALASQGLADNTVGLLFHGRPLDGRLEYAGGVFDNVRFDRAPGAAIRDTQDLMPAGRVVWNLLDPAEPANGYADYRESYIGQGQRLALGANGIFLSHARDDAFIATGPEFDLGAWGVDLFFNSGPWVFQAEYDEYVHNVVGAADRDGSGWYVQGGYLVNYCHCPCDGVLELAARYEELDDREGLVGQNDRLQWTSVGVNYYIREHNLKIQTDYTWRREDLVEIDNDLFQVQLQLDY